ncbi:MAG: sensor histidine kinase [Ktedonobacterales bacterium]|nr:sensor histidine kinase [Ktedonobacterales bacterium]
MSDAASHRSEGPPARPTDPNTWLVGISHGDLFAMPVLYRVLIVNSVVLVVGALLGTALTTELRGHNGSAVFVSFVIAGILLSLVANFVLLKMAFDPIRRVRDTMRRVEAGDMTLRAPISGYDPDADELAATFNHMLGKLNDSARSRAAQIMRAQEEERKRIARELHDETSQALTSLLVTLKLVEDSTTDPEAHIRVAESREVAHQTLRAIRNLSIDLRPSALDDLGLVPALRGYIRDYQQKYGLDVHFTVQGFRERASFEVETALYRIVQEALTNIARHAHAKRVTVDLREADGEAQLLVRDDGQGFDLAAPPKAPGSDGGLGLVGIRERVSLLSGQLDVTSSPSEGTSLHLTLPFHSDDQRGTDATTNTLA